jgi:hypothetical protein
MKFTKRIDLHCHSRASTEADEAMLEVIHCPESYSQPREIYAQAKERGMDFITITDHDSIAGVAELDGRADCLVGEEVTCYFPEDTCKIHLLVWGITQADHDCLQAAARNIYEVAEYVAKNDLAHAVAHPLYRQNGVLNRTHIERLLLLFKGFECLNGAHSMSHRRAFEPLIDDLDLPELRRLERRYRIDALWPRPWVKARTGGSDDHGLFNIGRTWTAFPDDVETTDQLLDCLREGRCRPGGEAGSSIKLAHNFYGVGMRYFTREVASDRDARSIMMHKMLGEKPKCGRVAMAGAAIKWYGQSLLDRVGKKLHITRPARGTDLLGQLLAASAMHRAGGNPSLIRAMKEGRSPIAEHESMFDLVCGINRDLSGSIFAAVSEAVAGGKLGEVFDAVSTILAHQALLMPYYFALFHQNQERDLLKKMMGRGKPMNGRELHVGLFTDSADDKTIAGRFAQDFASFAEPHGMRLTAHTSSDLPRGCSQHWKKFAPMIDRRFASLPMRVNIPPVLEVLEWSDRQQFDVVLVNTIGPMGLCGYLTSRMLRAPMIAVCHEDTPARVLEMTRGDYRTTAAVKAYFAWFFGAARCVLTNGREGHQAMEKIQSARAARLSPVDAFASVWEVCERAAYGESDDSQSMTDETPMEAVPA